MQVNSRGYLPRGGKPDACHQIPTCTAIRVSVVHGLINEPHALNEVHYEPFPAVIPQISLNFGFLNAPDEGEHLINQLVHHPLR